MIRRFHELFVNRSGIAAIEFALVLPIMLTLLVGIIEGVNLHLAGRKVVIAAQAAADLTSQEITATEAKLSDIFAAVTAVMAPYPTATLGYEVSSVEADAGGGITVGWRFSRGAIQGGGGGIPAEAPSLVSTSDSVIAVNITYRYQPALSLVFGDVDITERAFARPRRVRVIVLQ